MDKETKTLALCLLVMCGVLTALLMIALDRETEREDLQTQSWKDQGYPIGEKSRLEELVEQGMFIIDESGVDGNRYK